ncbi:MAG: fibronectin type III domain-containing protein [Thermomicrobiales bacterium]
MSGTLRSAPFRGAIVMSVGLLLLATFVAAPVFTHGSAADTPFGSPAFGTLWSSIEPVVPNFWGPAVQPALQEPYHEATNGSRLVQYFDKARMEQTTVSGPVTNGLLTVELITGQRQMGDASFAPFPPSARAVVGDPTNTWPPYSALGGGVFAAKVGQSGEPSGTVYKPDGTFGLNPGLGADPGAQPGTYQSDPGGKYAHNIPIALSSYLAALPIPWLSTMGLPLTEAFWVNVIVSGAPTWVLVQPFERRVLSYTPANPSGFQVEMGNIGQHYYQWRYVTNPVGSDALASGTTTTTTAAATTSGTPSGTITGTPGKLAIASVQLGTVTDTSFALTFRTSTPATTEILYGTVSHSYTSHQDVSTTAAQDHAVSLTGLQPGTKYYFALRATGGGASVQGKEDFFTTAGIAISPGTTKTPRSPAETATNPSKPPSSTPTTQAKIIHVTLSQVIVGASSPAQLDASVMRLESATVALSLAYDGSSNTVTSTAFPTTWVRDPVHATASCTTIFSPLSLSDKQTALLLVATATIPYADTTVPSLTVTFSRKISQSDYASGMTITSPPLDNAHNPGYNVTLAFSVALG